MVTEDDTKVRVDADFATSADALWGMVGDFTDLRWIPPVHHSEFEGEGPGMIRRMYLDETLAVVERLDALDPEHRTISYSVHDNNPLPVTGYRATITVVDTGPGTSRLEWRCAFDEPVGTTEAEAVATIEGFYEMMLGGMRAALGLEGRP